MDLPLTLVRFGPHRLEAEVASNRSTRQQGLMHRAYLAPGRAMLMAWEGPCHIWLWMRDTSIPLSVAFLDATGVVINTAELNPHDESRHWSRAPALYALETRRGWFAERGIGPGARAAFTLP